VRLASLTAAACAVVLLAGCGRAADPPAAPLQRVRLQVSTPADGVTVRSSDVEVSGSVVPASATVAVLGRRAQVAGGRFSIRVALDPGTTIVDVAASAARRRAAFVAVRVTREALVTVPDLGGTAEADIDAVVAPLGLRASIERAGGLLEAVLPGTRTVCRQEPAAGARVRRGRTITVLVGKTC
jgi:hypothetical protein